MAWVAAAGAGISGEMVRDMMLGCVERRFGAIRAPQPVQWLADNGSPYTAKETLDFAAALNLVPCFTPVRSPESNAAGTTPCIVSPGGLLPGPLTKVEQTFRWRALYNR